MEDHHWGGEGWNWTVEPQEVVQKLVIQPAIKDVKIKKKYTKM
jgi:hypothetical protein